MIHKIKRPEPSQANLILLPSCSLWGSLDVLTDWSEYIRRVIQPNLQAPKGSQGTVYVSKDLSRNAGRDESIYEQTSITPACVWNIASLRHICRLSSKVPKGLKAPGAAVLLNAGAAVNLTLCRTVNGSQNIEKMKSGFPSFCWFHYVPRAEFTTDVLQLDSNRGRR